MSKCINHLINLKKQLQPSVTEATLKYRVNMHMIKLNTNCRYLTNSQHSVLTSRWFSNTFERKLQITTTKASIQFLKVIPPKTVGTIRTRQST